MSRADAADPVVARLLSVNVGGTETVRTADRTYETAIAKRPVRGAVAIRGVNLEGDDQADRSVHGGADRALYAYASEDYAWWSAELGRALGAGDFGENLTTADLDLGAAVVGERWLVGDEVVLEVSTPRVPCFKLAEAVRDAGFVKRFAAALRPGPYLRVVRHGAITAGDTVRILSRPAHGLRIDETARISLFAPDELRTLLRAPELGEEFLRKIRARIATSADAR